MKRSETLNELGAALAKAQAEMGPAPKNKTNPFFKSSYADLESVWSACRGPLSKNGLSVTQFPGLEDGQFVLETTLIHSSGQWMSSSYPVVPIKNDPQGIGSALSYIRRYALSAIVGVVTDDDDGEGSMDRSDEMRGAQGHSNAKQGHSAPKPSGPLDYPWEKDRASEAQRKKLYAMTKSLDWEPAHSSDFILKNTGKKSSEELSKGEIQALFLLLEAEQAKMNKAAPK